MPRYWVGVASANHVARGVAGGFCQLCHGKAAPLRRMQPGDWLVYYSPAEEMRSPSTTAKPQPVQAFTAIGRVVGSSVYEFEMQPGFVPFRRDVAFKPGAKRASIRPLVAKLELTKDRGSKWGSAFRFGHVEVSAADFAIIAEAMGVSLSLEELEDGAAAASSNDEPRKRARVTTSSS